MIMDNGESFLVGRTTTAAVGRLKEVWDKRKCGEMIRASREAQAVAVVRPSYISNQYPQTIHNLPQESFPLI